MFRNYREINVKITAGKERGFRPYSSDMKKHWILLGCAVGLMLLPANVKAEEHTKLGEEMETLNDAIKGFRRETDAAKGAAQAHDAQQAALKSTLETPAMIKEMPDGPEKAKALVQYRIMMGKLFITLCQVEEAFLNGKMEEVTKIIDSLKEAKKEGHGKFIKEDE